MDFENPAKKAAREAERDIVEHCVGKTMKKARNYAKKKGYGVAYFDSRRLEVSQREIGGKQSPFWGLEVASAKLEGQTVELYLEKELREYTEASNLEIMHSEHHPVFFGPWDQVGGWEFYTSIYILDDANDDWCFISGEGLSFDAPEGRFNSVYVAMYGDGEPYRTVEDGVALAKEYIDRGYLKENYRFFESYGVKGESGNTYTIHYERTTDADARHGKRDLIVSIDTYEGGSQVSSISMYEVGFSGHSALEERIQQREKLGYENDTFEWYGDLED